MGLRTLEQLAETCEALGWEPPRVLVEWEAAHLWPENEPAWLAFRDLAGANGIGPLDIEAWCRLTGREPDLQLLRDVRHIEGLYHEQAAGPGGNPRKPASGRTHGQPRSTRHRR